MREDIIIESEKNEREREREREKERGMSPLSDTFCRWVLRNLFVIIEEEITNFIKGKAFIGNKFR